MTNHRNKTLEGRLRLPSKNEELELFTRFELAVLLERYAPLADFILDDYAYPNENTNIVVEEMLHNALLMSLIRYHKKDRYRDQSSFAFFYTMLAKDIMADYVKDGMAYQLSLTKVLEK